MANTSKNLTKSRRVNQQYANNMTAGATPLAPQSTNLIDLLAPNGWAYQVIVLREIRKRQARKARIGAFLKNPTEKKRTKDAKTIHESAEVVHKSNFGSMDNPFSLFYK